ncbi:malate:quinone oxidoreductase, partial [Pseudomonas aeruginosa]
ASVTVSIMLGLIERCFPEQARSPEWSAKLKEIFPAREKELESDAELYRSVSSRCSEVLELTAKNDVQAPVNAE